jgi:hypothetical protein
MQQVQKAKDRRDIRDQKQQDMKKQMRDLDRIQKDPSANETTKDMV